MIWCTTIDSKNQIFITKDKVGFLHLSSIEKTTTFWTCMFSSESDHKFKGNLYLNDQKYENISGTLHFDNSDNSFHYDIYDANKKEITSFDTKLSAMDYQNTLFTYEPFINL